MVLWCSKITEFSSEPSWHIFFTVVQTLTVNQLIVNQHTEPIILERRQKLQKEAAVLTSYIKHNQDSIHTLMMICQRSVHRVKGQGQIQKFKRLICKIQNSIQCIIYECAHGILRDELMNLSNWINFGAKGQRQQLIIRFLLNSEHWYHVRVPMAYWETNLRMTYCDQDY